VAEAWFGVTAKGCNRNWIHFFCEGGWVVVCILVDVLGGKMVGLVLFFHGGGRYGVQRRLIGP